MLRFVLGSRSPRRRELLQQIVPADQIDIVPPASSDEAGFDGLTDWPSIRSRMQEITRYKSTQVRQQLGALADNAVVICADTSIIISESRQCVLNPAEECPLPGPLRVIGQPPTNEPRAETLRQWYHDYYAGRTHLAATLLRVTGPSQREHERIITTQITFRDDIDPWFAWYVASGEPQGKAGGYAVQGAGSVFMTSIVGSLTNVIGLPLEALLEIFWAERYLST
jgi:septum formation protein